MQNHRFIAPLLLILTLLTFYRVPKCQFVYYDDNVYVTDNPFVRQGLTRQNVAWAFSPRAAIVVGNYHPLTWLSLMLDTTLMGNGPFGYHLVNLLLHAAAVLILYAALTALTGSPWRSGIVAALFAIHPLRVESVAWVSERKDVLSGCLAFATLLAYAYYARRPGLPGWRRYLLVFVLLSLGLLAKPMLVTLPFVLLLLDFWPLERLRNSPTAGQRSSEAEGAPTHAIPQQLTPPRRLAWLIIEKLPLLALAFGGAVTTYLAQQRVSAVRGLEELPLPERLANVSVSYVRYLGKMVWFQGLIINYPFLRWPTWQVLLSAAALLAITGVVLWRLRRQPWLAVGWFWFVGMLVPVVGIVQVGNQSMADRYTYLPSIGLLIMVVWSVPSRALASPLVKVAIASSLVVALIILGLATRRQVGYWQDSIALFRHVIDVEPGHEVAMVNLGIALGEKGDTDGALHLFRTAVSIQPNSPQAQTNLGNSLLRHGQTQEALIHLRRGAELQPDRAPPHNFLGVALAQIGQLDEAVVEYRWAIKVDPDYAQAHINLAHALSRQGQFNEALGEFQKAIQLNPDDAEAYLGVAAALSDMGRVQQALPFFAEVIRRRPEMAVGHAALGMALAQIGRTSDARVELQKAVNLDEGNPRFRALLERVSSSSPQAPLGPVAPTPSSAWP